MPPSTVDGEFASPTQPRPLKPAPFARQRLTEAMLTTRTPEAHAAVLARFRTMKSGMFEPPSLEGTIVFPGFDGGAEWGGAAFDPATGLLYVNSNEMPWIVKLIPNNDTSLYNSKCATCHREDRTGGARRAVARGHRREALARRDRDRRAAGHRPHAGVPRHGRAQHQRRRRVPHHRQGQGRRSGAEERSRAGSSTAATASRSSSTPTAIRPSRRRGAR